MSERKHLASKRYGPSGSRIYCHACDWVSPVELITDRAMREAHRQHRREMGEEVTGTLKLEMSERLRYLRQLHVAIEDNVRVDGDGSVTRGLVCPQCRVPWPCLQQRLLDGEADAVEALEEVVRGRG